MANWFVDSVQGVGGLGDGTSWANAYLTLAAALSAKAAGDTFWVGDDHAETQASAMTLTSPGTTSNPCFVYCVDHTKASPGAGDLKTTATITTTGNFAIIQAGSGYFYGITFSSGTGANSVNLTIGSTSNGAVTFESCAMRLGGTSGFCNILANSGPGLLTLINTTMQVANIASTLQARGGVINWKNTAAAITGATIPTNMLSAPVANAFVGLEGLDLSALSAKTIQSAGSVGRTFIKDCQLPATVTVAAAPTAPGFECYSVRSDSSGTSYRCEKYAYAGTETTETSVTRVGGASDGTTLQSRKIVTTANSKWVLPFESLPLAIWNDATSVNRTITIFGTWNAAALPNNDDIWIEVEYPGASGSPLGSFASSTKANNLATGVALTADGSTWNGGGSGAGWSPFSMSVTLSAPQPQLKGPLTIRIKAAKTSSTFYIDPAAVLS